MQVKLSLSSKLFVLNLILVIVAVSHRADCRPIQMKTAGVGSKMVKYTFTVKNFHL